MNEAAQVFYADVREKKRTSYGVHNHNRTGKGRVRFPSDHLTNKQRREMSGPMRQFDMSGPMPWQDFKQMPEDLRGEYLRNVIERFHPTQQAMADMFHISKSTMIRTLNELRIRVTGKGRSTPAWNAWLSAAQIQPEAPDEIADEDLLIGVPEYDTEAVQDGGADASGGPPDSGSAPDTADADRFSVCRADNLTVNATPAEVAQLLTLLSGPQRRVFRISFGDPT